MAAAQLAYGGEMAAGIHGLCPLVTSLSDLGDGDEGVRTCGDGFDVDEDEENGENRFLNPTEASVGRKRYPRI
jgi:hypothetical protein